MEHAVARPPKWRRWWLWVAIAVLAGAGIGTFGWLQGEHRGRIAGGVWIMGVDVGGLTRTQALDELQTRLARSGGSGSSFKRRQIDSSSAGCRMDAMAEGLTVAPALLVGDRLPNLAEGTKPLALSRGLSPIDH